MMRFDFCLVGLILFIESDVYSSRNYTKRRYEYARICCLYVGENDFNLRQPGSSTQPMLVIGYKIVMCCL